MKKVLFVLIALFMATAFISCSDDDDDYKAAKNLDASLLPGYWIAVKDGVRQNSGVWFSDEPEYRGGKTVVFFHLLNGMDAPADRYETSYWWINDKGDICIHLYEGSRTIISLTKDKMIMRSAGIDSDHYTDSEYERISSPIEMKE